MPNKYRFSKSKETIIDILQNRNAIKESCNKKILTLAKEIEILESDKNKDSELAALSLSGRAPGQDSISPTNAIPDPLGNVLQQYSNLKEERIKVFQKKIEDLYKLQMYCDEIWSIYLGLDYHLYEILKFRYVENRKFDEFEKEKSWSRSKISQMQTLGIQAIQAELTNGKGASHSTYFTENRTFKNVKNRGKDDQLEGQITLEQLVNSDINTK